MVLSSTCLVHVYVCGVDGTVLEVDLDGSASFGVLKRKVAERWCVPPLALALASKAHELEDVDALQKCLQAGETSLDVTAVVSLDRLYAQAVKGEMQQRERAVEDIGQVMDKDYDSAVATLGLCVDPIAARKPVRLAAVEVLAKAARQGEEKAIDVLRRFLSDQSHEVRLTAAEGLARVLTWQEQEAVAEFSAFLHRADANVKREVIAALVEQGSGQAFCLAPLEMLARCLNDTSASVQCAAAEALGHLIAPGQAPQAVVQQLTAQLWNKHPEVMAATRKTLAKVGGSREELVIQAARVV
eukprot:gb/GFBE01073771.1/.p1 GENE.gb/GFBE01073771.1/~~gb/GFBE01073771.1/.p1  ORF type:complete len:300 (+),score=71.85 gb/GFBE01073771.1/:1-900(+)